MYPLHHSEALNLRFIDQTALRDSASPPNNVRVGTSPPPSSLNYNSQGFVTSIKNQGQCGSCWAFASVAMYESLLLMKGFNYGLSEEASL